MKIVGKLWVAVMLALLVSSVAAASAFAETGEGPEMYLYSASTFNSGGGAISLETPHSTVTCENTFGNLGRDGTPWGFEGSISFSKCKQFTEINGFKVTGPCTSPGSAEGEITTSQIEAKLVYLSKAAKEVGLVLNWKKTGEVTTFATFTCTILGRGEKFTERGTALAKATPVNVKSETFNFTLSGSKGVPGLSQYENGSGVKVTTSLETQRGAGSWEGTSLNDSVSPLHFVYSGGLVAELRA